MSDLKWEDLSACTNEREIQTGPLAGALNNTVSGYFVPLELASPWLAMRQTENPPCVTLQILQSFPFFKGGYSRKEAILMLYPPNGRPIVYMSPKAFPWFQKWYDLNESAPKETTDSKKAGSILSPDFLEALLNIAAAKPASCHNEPEVGAAPIRTRTEPS